MSNPLVLMETSSGDILLELFEDRAPATVANFLRYVDEDFYTNTIFHRVINDTTSINKNRKKLKPPSN